jgi:hypothetical protein
MLDISLLMLWHMLIGSAVVCSGLLALLLEKGSVLHRLAGRVFVVSMLLMGPIIAATAWFSPENISSLGILFVFFILYLVVSGWPTTQLSKRNFVVLNITTSLVALCIFVAGLVMGFDKLNNPIVGENVPPDTAYFFFAAIAFIAMLLDIHNLRKGGVVGKHKLVRHVWRMNCALFFATSTLFTGPGSVVFPESIRGNPLLSVPQFIVLIMALFWIYRLFFSKKYYPI